MNRKKLTALVLAGVLTAGVITAAATQGDKEDPLITLSYLQKIFTPQMEGKVDEAVKKNEAGLKSDLNAAIDDYEKKTDAALDASSAFQSQSVAAKKTLTLPAGRELLLVSGSAQAVGKLTDTTAGAAVADGSALVEGHLYVTAEADCGLKAASACQVMTR